MPSHAPIPCASGALPCHCTEQGGAMPCIAWCNAYCIRVSCVSLPHPIHHQLIPSWYSHSTAQHSTAQHSTCSMALAISSILPNILIMHCASPAPSSIDASSFPSRPIPVQHPLEGTHGSLSCCCPHSPPVWLNDGLFMPLPNTTPHFVGFMHFHRLCVHLRMRT